MNKKRLIRISKIMMIILLSVLLTLSFVLLKNKVNNKTNTTVNEKDSTIMQAKNDDTTAAQDVQQEKQIQSDPDSLEKETQTETTQDKVTQDKIIQIKTYENRLGEKAKASLNDWKNSIIELSKKHPDKIILKGKGNEKIVALTFDDGPDRDITPQIIDELNKYHAKGTFFFEGDRIEHNEDIVKKAFNSGHQIANHSFSHPMFTKISKEKITREISKTNDLINSSIDKEPVFLRPPYGDIDENSLSYLEDNCRSIIWSLDTFDWVKGTSSTEIAKFVINSIEPEDIVLMHSSNGKQETLKAVPLMIEGLREKGYEFVTVSELLGENAYK